jgi:hypothetical protein
MGLTDGLICSDLCDVSGEIITTFLRGLDDNKLLFGKENSNCGEDGNNEGGCDGDVCNIKALPISVNTDIITPIK